MFNRLLLFLLLYVVSVGSYAATEKLLAEISQSSQWRALLHYQTSLTGHESQADDERFFLASTGKYDALAELKATIHAFKNETASPGENDSAAQCRFPARWYFLNQRLDLEEKGVVALFCPEFNHWLNELNPESISLIFPAAFLNGPSSMFGHTLLRLNPSDYRAGSALAAYALNYAADSVEDDSGIEYLVKGLFGGYPGRFDIVPYYAKIKEYNDIESRDIWEFDLDLTADEIQLLMRHTWEVKNIRFDYYFFSENCSYRLLTLLDVARPGTGIVDGFDYRAIPADTVKAVRRAGFIGDSHYRASTTSALISKQQQLTAKQLELAFALADGELTTGDNSLAELSEMHRARIIEMAYDLLQNNARYQYDPERLLAKRSLQLLRARNQLNIKNIWLPPARPEFRDDEGHDTQRVALAVATDDQTNFFSLYYRPAFHEIVDPLPGYRLGSQINFFDFHVQYQEDTNQWRVQQFKLIDVLSATPRTTLFRPFSWSLALGTEYRAYKAGDVNVFFSEFSGGLSYAPWPQQVLTASVVASLDAAKKLDKGYAAGSGYELSAIINSRNSAGRISYRAMDIAGGETARMQSLRWQQAYHFTRNESLRLSVEREQRFKQTVNNVELAWHHYF